MKRLLIATVAFTALFSGVAYADYDNGSIVTRGTSRAWTPTADGVPYIIPLGSNRTHRRERNFQPGPFHELDANEKVEWRQ